MHRACPDPRCTDGHVVHVMHFSPHHDELRGRTRVCPTCQGRGTIDEREADLRHAGIVTWGVTEEDFRSSPTLVG